MTSRTDLLAWLNDLLQINYTKIEQCGSGGAYCQIIDSIYGASSAGGGVESVTDCCTGVFPRPII